jgi:hypothetical protein
MFAFIFTCKTNKMERGGNNIATLLFLYLCFHLKCWKCELWRRSGAYLFKQFFRCTLVLYVEDNKVSLIYYSVRCAVLCCIPFFSCLSQLWVSCTAEHITQHHINNKRWTQYNNAFLCHCNRAQGGKREIIINKVQIQGDCCCWLEKEPPLWRPDGFTVGGCRHKLTMFWFDHIPPPSLPPSFLAQQERTMGTYMYIYPLSWAELRVCVWVYDKYKEE